MTKPKRVNSVPLEAVGIDLGGTKIEASLFGRNWEPLETRRISTPQSYNEMLQALSDLVSWADALADKALPVGIGAAGMVQPKTGSFTAANHAAAGRPFKADFEGIVERHVSLINDGDALALSEAVLGSGYGHSRVAALVVGTGIRGGFVVDGRVAAGAFGVSGEIGHIALPASIATAFKLPVLRCGCGRDGCYETLISGPGLARLAAHMTGRNVDAFEIVQEREGEFRDVWNVWCALVGELLRTVGLTFDPNVVVLGGGLSRVSGVATDLQTAAAKAQFDGFDCPEVVVAQGGDASGARGAAYAAWQESSGSRSSR